jgi:outer membrane protein TolC
VKFIFLSLLLFIALSENLKAESSLTENQSFDLKKTILIAMENSPYFDSLKRQKNISDLEEQSAGAKLLPNLDLSTTHGIQNTSPHQSNHPWTSEFQLALTETLYDNGASKTQYRIATLSKAQAEFKFLDQKNKLSLDIASQFLTYSRDMKLLEIQEKQFKLISKQYAAISKDYYQGIKTKKDFLRFKTQVSRSDIDLLNARNTTEKSKSELLKLIGIDINSTVKIGFMPIALTFSENQIPDLTIKIENHFQYKIAQVEKEINQLQADLVNRKNLPEWYASAGINYSSSDYLGTAKSFTNNGIMGWNMLLTIKYNLN